VACENAFHSNRSRKNADARRQKENRELTPAYQEDNRRGEGGNARTGLAASNKLARLIQTI
jgi:hypothetical protein